MKDKEYVASRYAWYKENIEIDYKNPARARRQIKEYKSKVEEFFKGKKQQKEASIYTNLEYRSYNADKGEVELFSRYMGELDRIRFTNTNQFDTFPIPPSIAEKMIDEKANIYLTVNFKIKPYVDEESFNLVRPIYYGVGEITSVVYFYDSIPLGIKTKHGFLHPPKYIKL